MFEGIGQWLYGLAAVLTFWAAFWFGWRPKARVAPRVPTAFETANILVGELERDGHFYGALPAGVLRASRFSGGYRVFCGSRFKLCESSAEVFEFVYQFLTEREKELRTQKPSGG